MVLNLRMYQNYLEGLFKLRFLVPTTEFLSDSQGLEWGLIICICNEFIDDVDFASPETRAQRSTSMVKYVILGVGPCNLWFTKTSR